MFDYTGYDNSVKTNNTSIDNKTHQNVFYLSSTGLKKVYTINYNVENDLRKKRIFEFNKG
jgi:hypothetical protein